MHDGRVWRVIAVTTMLLLLTGCVPQAEYSGVLEQYKTASLKLGESADLLFTQANAVEEESYIETQAFERQPLSRTAIEAHLILSGEGLRFRQRAIVALSNYTLLLASAASGKAEAQIAADASAAGTSLTALTADVQAAIAKDHPDAKTSDFSGAVGAAASAAGELIQLLERRHSRAEVQASLRKNDPAMRKLYELIGADATRLYTRHRLTVQNRGDILFGSYAAALKQAPADPAYLLDLSDRLMRYRRDLGVLTASDPAAAFSAWEHAHDELVSALLEERGSTKQRSSLRQIAVTVQNFAVEVQPLATNLQRLAGSL